MVTASRPGVATRCPPSTAPSPPPLGSRHRPSPPAPPRPPASAAADPPASPPRDRAGRPDPARARRVSGHHAAQATPAHEVVPEEERDRRPHRVELPHVPQVACDGEPGLAVAQHHPRELPRERPALEAVRAVAIRRQHQQPARRAGHRRAGQHQRRAPSLDRRQQVRNRLPHGERPHDRADGEAARVPEPGRDHLHRRRRPRPERSPWEAQDQRRAVLRSEPTRVTPRAQRRRLSGDSSAPPERCRKFRNAATAVPATNPCTTVVRPTSPHHPHCAASSGESALAVNQSDIPMSSATASRTRVLQGPRGT